MKFDSATMWQKLTCVDNDELMLHKIATTRPRIKTLESIVKEKYKDKIAALPGKYGTKKEKAKYRIDVYDLKWQMDRTVVDIRCDVESVHHLENVVTAHANAEEAIQYAHDFCMWLLNNKITINNHVYAYMRRDLPYVLESNGCVVNRNYKPLGHTNRTTDFVDYDDYPQCKIVNLEGFANFRKQHPASGYLFHDGSTPWRHGNIHCLRGYTVKLKELIKELGI